MNLLIILVIFVTFFIFFTKLIIALTGKASELFLTRYFREIEALFVESKLPEDWVQNLRKIANRKRKYKRLDRKEQARAFLLLKIADLRTFFKTCRFVESEEARTLLLSQIENLKETWETADMSEILTSYNLDIDFNKEVLKTNSTTHGEDC